MDGRNALTYTYRPVHQTPPVYSFLLDIKLDCTYNEDTMEDFDPSVCPAVFIGAAIHWWVNDRHANSGSQYPCCPVVELQMVDTVNLCLLIEL